MQVKHRKEEKKIMKELWKNYSYREETCGHKKKTAKKQRTGRTHAGIHSTIASNAAKNTRADSSSSGRSSTSCIVTTRQLLAL